MNLCSSFLRFRKNGKKLFLEGVSKIRKNRGPVFLSGKSFSFGNAGASDRFWSLLNDKIFYGGDFLDVDLQIQRFRND